MSSCPAEPVTLAGLTLDEIATAVGAQSLPPVDRWHPERCGHSQIRIAADGSWHHEGRPIARPELVRLFATILRREPDGRFVLVTPAEKLDVEVEDAPLVAVELASEGAGADRRIAFRLNTETLVVAGPAHPIALRDGAPYLLVRAGIEARIARAPYYELAELALAEGAAPAGVWSDGAFFALEPA